MKSIDYRIIDADSHINSPPDLYQSRVPAKYKARAPKVVSGDGYDAWFADFNGVIEEINLDQSKVRVLVNIFGRDTPVELNFEQIVKL